MKKYVMAVLITSIFSLGFWPMMFSQIWVYYSLNLPGDCEVDVYGKALQPFVTVVVACTRMDMIWIWLLPVVDPWFEDWWEGTREIMMNG